jgi:hypothetical protein
MTTIFPTLLEKITQNLLTHIQKLFFNYFWKGSYEYPGSHLLSWKILSKPKKIGGWGFKGSFFFG